MDGDSSCTVHQCPKCGNKEFQSLRALSIHMHTCDALFSHSMNDTTQKRTHMQLTLAQRAEQIFQSMKRPHTSGHQLNVNRLAVPHVSSSVAFVPQNLANDDDSDVYNSSGGVGHDYGTGSDFSPECSPFISSSTNCYQFDRNLNPPPGVKFCIHLQHIISSHRGVDLAMYDEIVDLIQFHATTQETDFSTNKLYHRNELTKTLTELYNLTALQPRLHPVVLSDSATVTVPVFDVKAVILSMLHDPQRMQSCNFAPGYDIFTGVPTDTQYSYLDEIHTGSVWQSARDFYCGTNNDNFPLGLLCFYDKTHTDLFGSLSCAPFIITFSFFNENARSNDAFYRVLGYIPNLSYGSGKSSKKTPRDKLQDEHTCLKLITDQICALAHGFKTTVLGRRVTIKPWIHFIAGDTSGHNNLVGQYNSSSAMFPYRDCTCVLSQLSDPIAQCKLITVADYTAAKTQEELHNFSLHDINNAFDSIPFGDLQHGLFGSVPAEMLHVSGNGIMQYQLDVINGIISAGPNKRNTMHRLDILHQNIVKWAALQSEQDMPRTSDRNGITDGTKMSASERVGNMFVLLCAMHTDVGKEIFSDGCQMSRISLQQIKDCLKLQLGFEKWVNDTNTIEDVHRATPLLAELITRIKTSFPRQDGNGWLLPKMHSLSKMLHYMSKFGKAKNFSGQVGERVLKSIVKDHSQQTQRRVTVFASQCAQREFESFVHKYAYNDVAHCFGEHFQRTKNIMQDSTATRGQHQISFAACDHRGRGEVSVTWKDNKRRVEIHPLVTHTLRTYALSQGWKDSFIVHGFTSAYLHCESYQDTNLFYANPFVYGGERYHFCMVNFFDGNEETQSPCPARILSFVQFETHGFPKPEPLENNSNALYAIVHTATKFITWNELDSLFVLPFCLGDVKSCVYIVNVSAISDPLFVCPNYGKDGLHYLCCLPYRRWGKYFEKKIT